MSNRVKDINLLEAYKKQTQVRTSRSSGRIYLVIFLATALILGALTIKLLIEQRLLDNQVNQLQEYVNNPTRQERLREVEKMQADIDSLEVMEDEISGLSHVMDLIPRYNRRVINTLDVVKPAGITIQSIDYDGSWVHVNVTADFLPSMSNYALALERTGQFEEVYYDGYSAGDGVYTSTIHVALKSNLEVSYE